MKHVLPDGLRSPLGRRLIMAIVLVSSAVTLVLSVVDLSRRYHEEMGEVHDAIGQIERTHLKPLAQAAWSTDERTLRLLVDGIKALPGIESVWVSDDNGVVEMQVGARTSRHVIEKQYALGYSHRGTVAAVGTLTVVADLEHVYRDLVGQAVSVLLGNALKTFMVALFALAFFHALVNRHLLSIAKYLRHLDFGRPTAQLRLARTPTTRPDEFDTVVGAITDMERSNRVSLASVQASEALLRASFEQTAVGLAHIGADQRIQRVNRKLEELLGRPADALVGHSPTEFSHPDDIARALQAIDFLREGHAPSVVMEKRYLRPDSSSIWLRVTLSLSRDEGGNAQHNIAVFEDITAARAADRALRDSETRYRTLVQASPDAVLILRSGQIVFANAAAMQLFGASKAQQLLGRNVLDLVRADSRAPAEQCLAAFERGALAQPLTERVYLRLDGAPVDVEVISTRFDYDGAPAVLTVARDVTERKREQHLLEMEHAVTRSLASADSASSGVQLALRALCEALGWKAARFYESAADGRLQRYADSREQGGAANHPADVTTPNLDFARSIGLVDRARRAGQPVWETDLAQKPAIAAAFDGARGIHCALAFPVMSQGKAIGVVATYSDRVCVPDDRLLQALRAIGDQLGQFLERRRAEARLAHLAQFDTLTGLPNRALFRDRIGQALAQAGRNSWQVGVLMVDLDHFKWVNDSMGHGAGDALLREAGARLRGCLGAGDTVARLGGDEFGLLLPDVASNGAAQALAEKALDALRKPYVLQGKEVFIGASIGITLYPLDGEDADSLVRNADAAMYRAKDMGRNGCQFFTPELNAQAARQLDMEKDLRYALQRGEYELHYQPKTSADGSRVTGMEALLRWRRADGSLVSPADFIPVLEKTGLIAEVGDWVVREAARQIADWARRGLPGLRVAVNVSTRQFRGGEIVDSVRRALDESGCAPQCLEIEITESQVMHDVAETIAGLTALRALGVRVAVDDFGTGHSSLAYLKKLPIDTIKVDRSFVRELSEEGEDAAITTAIVSLAHTLGFRVVAEGVETPAQQKILVRLGCDEIQGFLISRPVPAEALFAWLSGRSRVDCAQAKVA